MVMVARNVVLGGWLMWLANALASLPAVADAQDFRVDTEVFFDQQKAPGLETLTIFTGGRVFDFMLTEPREVAIYDPQRGLFTLLNEARQVQARVKTGDLLEFTENLKTEALKRKDVLLNFAAQPEFETTFEEITQNGQPLVRVKLAGKALEYVVLGQKPERPEAVQLYRHFADWFARLNATSPGNLPPGARLVLNQTLAERELMPLEITLTIQPTRALGKKDEIKSRHLVNWTLSGEDQKKIERTDDWLAKFRVVSFDAYRKPGR
jgi:hypothetical protein